MIDPVTLKRMRFDLGLEPRMKAKTQRCGCGECRKCYNRRWMARYRAAKAEPCVVCGELRGGSSHTGRCVKCNGRVIGRANGRGGRI